MTPQVLIETYGYLAIFIGSFLEGETILAMAGFAAQLGYLDLSSVVAAGICGGFLGDQTYFFVGRHHGKGILARFPRLVHRAAKTEEWLFRYHTPLIICIRFMYGLRIVGPLVFGMGPVSAAKFATLNFIGASVWAMLVAGTGFLFGHGLELMLADAERYELVGLTSIALIGLLLWALHRFHVKDFFVRRRRHG